MSFLACRIDRTDTGVAHTLVKMEIPELSAGDVTVKVLYSGVNYKDALAATGRGQILKKFPLNGGIDLAGIVEQSDHSDFQVGDEVIVNGCGLGEEHDGGLAEFARVPADWVIKKPDGLSLLECMTLGTAGFTAGLAIHRMQENNQVPEKGSIVVTGASGGVGSIAVDMLNCLGYEVIAISGRREFDDYLRMLGATEVCSVEDLSLGSKPLEKGRFGGVIDNVGGQLLSQLIAHTNLWGNVASIGLADSHKLDSTVFPFILRGVSLLGVSSTNCPMPLRRQIWNKLGGSHKPKHLDKILTEVVPLSNVSEVFNELLDRKKHGRIVIDCQK